jgi:hypothetical protein
MKEKSFVWKCKFVMRYFAMLFPFALLGIFLFAFTVLGKLGQLFVALHEWYWESKSIKKFIISIKHWVYQTKPN